MNDQEFELLETYLAELHRGGKPARDTILAHQPQLMGLLDCLDGLERLAMPAEIHDGPPTIQVEPKRAEEPSTIELPRRLGTFGKYCLEAELGRGGMGVVYRARQIDLDRPVAVKMVLSSHLASPEALERFKHEARAAASLTHPHIVAVYEAGEIDGQPYFAMQYIEGCSLGERVRSSPISPDEAARIVHRVAEAVHHLHCHDIVHRDLKPSNILLDQACHPYVTDFGLVKFLGGDQHTTTGAIVGTPSYMSPEQATGRKDLGPTSDVYSLGAILYELLTGQPPFREGNPLDTLVQALESEPVPPRRLCPQIPADLELICLRCLEKAPGERFASAQELAEALDAFLKGEETGLTLPGVRYRVRQWARREPALASRLVMLPICLLIAQTNYFLLGEAALERHWRVLAILGVWGAVSCVCQWMMNHKPWAAATRFVWAALDVVLFSLIVLVADDIETPVVIGFPLIIVATGLWFRVPLVWFTAAVCIVSYLLLLLERELRTGIEGPHKHAIFLVGLGILAVMMSYQVHRVRALSRYYEHRRLP
jgi:eukaryotic-like serine/threonine-protein kinase